MTDDTYNGWKNYPTWAVNMWLSNDEGLYNEATERAKDVHKQSVDGHSNSRVLTDRSWAIYTLADHFKEWVTDDLAPDLGASFAADLLGYALDCVDWDEIASAWLEEVEAE